MRNTVPLSPTEAVDLALRGVDSAINAGIEPNKAITVTASRWHIDRDKLEALYIERGRQRDDD